MPHNVASDLGAQCLLMGFFTKTRMKGTKKPDTPKTTNGLVQHITVEESTSIQWVKRIYFTRSNYAIFTCTFLVDGSYLFIFPHLSMGVNSYRKEFALEQILFFKGWTPYE